MAREQQERNRMRRSSSGRRNPPSYMVVAVVLGAAGWYGNLQNTDEIVEQVGRQLLRLPSEHEMLPNITLFEDVCPEEFPPIHAKLHDPRPEMQEHYKNKYGIVGSHLNNDGVPKFRVGTVTNATSTDIPEFIELTDNPMYAIWLPKKHSKVEQSAWSESEGVVKGLGFVKYKDERHKVDLILRDGGYYIGYTSWFNGNFGHFVHDHLPTIALLKAYSPPHAKFLLMKSKVAYNILYTIDPEFVDNRVIWLEWNQVAHIRNGGTLLVSIPNSLPSIGGCCRQYDFMRQWVGEKRLEYGPYDTEQNRQRTVLFYTRLGSSDNKHGRVLEPMLERRILTHIRAYMRKYNRTERLEIFSGQLDGKTMPMEMQFQMFRSATTIIGPHGSGLGGNLLWTNPYPTSCDDRIQLIEFTPGPDSAHVQNLYANYYTQWRKWPIDYHHIFYQKESTSATTFIDLRDLDSALEAVWGPKPERIDLQSV